MKINSKIVHKLKFLAFTLAEVLIVMGIIGIVAEMTIPTILQNTLDAQMNSSIKAAYSILSQALISAVSDNGGTLGVETTTGTWTDHNNLTDKFAPELKYSKRGSGYALMGLSGAIKYKYYKNNSTNSGWPDASETGNNVLNLNNGFILYFMDESGIGYTGGLNDCAQIWVDVNGNKTPNMAGVDLLGFFIVKTTDSYKLVPMGSPGDGMMICALNQNFLDAGFGCTYLRLYTPSSLP